MKGRTLGYIENGRRAARYPCPSCQQRYRVGEPKVQDNWPAKLSIPVEQMDLLLIAAAEYIMLSGECQNCYHGAHENELCRPPGEVCRCQDYAPLGHPDVVGFLDWCRPDAVNPGSGSIGSLLYLTEQQR